MARQKGGRMSTNRYEVTDGPSAHQLFLHVEHVHSKTVTVKINFKTSSRLAGPIQTSAYLGFDPIITGIQHKDGSGYSFLLEGYIYHKRFRGFYNSQTRKGWIEIENK